MAWPSKNNPSAPHRGTDAPADGSSLSRREWWYRKNDIVDEWLDDAPNRAARPVSVIGSTKLREEASMERAGESIEFRSRSWSEVLREFLGWYNGYRFSHLLLRDPDGELVRTQMKNSHQPGYGNVYYAKLKALERRIIDQFDNPHIVMLTLTASNRNARGGWRCPADHLRDVVDPFTDHVRPALHRALGSNGADVDEWEYVKVLEHHKTGYGHMHIAIFVDGEVSEEDFHPPIDAHLRHCDPAHRDAHDYYHHDPQKRPISVHRVDTDLELDPDPNRDDIEAVGNLGSYLAEYIGTYGEELFDRSIEELAFRAVCWATSTHRVDFSNGAEEYISAELDYGSEETVDDPRASWKPGVTEEDVELASQEPDRKVSDLVDVTGRGWEFEGIGVVDSEGEDVYNTKHTGVCYVQIEDASHLDPSKKNPPDRPRVRSQDSQLSDFG